MTARRLLSWVALILGSGAALLTAVVWIDLGSTWMVAVQALSPMAVVMAAVALLAGAVAVGGRRRRVVATVASIAALVAHGALLAPWVTGTRANDGELLTVMSVNALFGGADPDDLMAAVERTDPDVLSIVELTPEAVEAFDRAGLDAALPHRVLAPGPDARGSGLYSRLPLTVVDTPEFGLFAMPTATLRRAGRTVTVRSVHPAAPQILGASLWHRELAQLADWASRTSGPTVLIGDLNAGLYHPRFRQLLERGRLHDAHELAGLGMPRTWPIDGSIPPFVHIDHVLVRGFGVQDAEVTTVTGSDHGVVSATLRLPEAAR